MIHLALDNPDRIMRIVSAGELTEAKWSGGWLRHIFRPRTTVTRCTEYGCRCDVSLTQASSVSYLPQHPREPIVRS